VARRCEGPKLITRVINFELVQPLRPRCLNVTHRQTDWRMDGQTDDLLQQYNALHYVHRAVINEWRSRGLLDSEIGEYT